MGEEGGGGEGREGRGRIKGVSVADPWARGGGGGGDPQRE